MMLSDVCLSDVCLSIAYIGPKSRTERLRKTKIGTEVAHVRRDSDTIFKVKRSKVKVTGGGGILWRPRAQLVQRIGCMRETDVLGMPAGLAHPPSCTGASNKLQSAPKLPICCLSQFNEDAGEPSMPALTDGTTRIRTAVLPLSKQVL